MTVHYSEALPDAVAEATRLTKARQIHSTIAYHRRGQSTHDLTLLDYGASTGIMSAYFAERFKIVVGVDVDRPAITRASRRFGSRHLSFHLFDGTKLPLLDARIDVVVANQVYNCVDDHDSMFREIHRVLKPGGICFLGARNKYALVEAQYQLPLLSMLPMPLARAYLRAARGTPEFVGSNYLSYGALMRHVSHFIVHDYTLAILRRPADFGFESLERYAGIARLLPLEALRWAIPNFVIILEKAVGTGTGAGCQ